MNCVVFAIQVCFSISLFLSLALVRSLFLRENNGVSRKSTKRSQELISSATVGEIDRFDSDSISLILSHGKRRDSCIIHALRT